VARGCGDRDVGGRAMCLVLPTHVLAAILVLATTSPGHRHLDSPFILGQSLCRSSFADSRFGSCDKKELGWLVR
jgi:hypothetical protein